MTTTWLMVWYVVLVLPLAALAPSRRLRTATLGLCSFVVLTRVSLPMGQREIPFAWAPGS